MIKSQKLFSNLTDCLTGSSVRVQQLGSCLKALFTIEFIANKIIIQGQSFLQEFNLNVDLKYMTSQDYSNESKI